MVQIFQKILDRGFKNYEGPNIPLQTSLSYTEFHYSIFPKAIGQIVHAYGVQEFHLSLTRGRWKTQLWGYPPLFAPSGVEAWAWFLPEYGYDILY